MANIARGLDHIGSIAETLNNIIQTTGKKIDINNRQIWDGYLHRWDNQDWSDMLAGFGAVIDTAPDSVKAYHKNNYERAITALKKDRHSTDRALDKKANKRIAWAMINTFREVWNSIHDLDIPNEDAKKVQKPMPKVIVEQTEEYTRTTVFHNLFEVQE